MVNVRHDVRDGLSRQPTASSTFLAKVRNVLYPLLLPITLTAAPYLYS